MSATGSSFSRANSGMRMNEKKRLEKETDVFTKQLEMEKRRQMILEDQIRQFRIEIEEKEERIKSIRPDTETEKALRVKLKNLRNAQKNEELKLNETTSKNKALKREINTMRRDLISADTEIANLKGSIEKLMKDPEHSIKKQNQLYIEHKKNIEETNNQILSLKAKHEVEKKRFEKEIESINLKLKAEDKDKERLHKGDGKGGGKTSPKLKAEYSNPITVLKRRLAKMTSTNIQKRKLIDQYIKNVSVIQDAFNQIQEATGINLNEIVTTFIKAEEQNYSLYNYVNRLNNETDQLDEANKILKEDIIRYRE